MTILAIEVQSPKLHKDALQQWWSNLASPVLFLKICNFNDQGPVAETAQCHPSTMETIPAITGIFLQTMHFWRPFPLSGRPNRTSLTCTFSASCSFDPFSQPKLVISRPLIVPRFTNISMILNPVQTTWILPKMWIILKL